MIDSIMNMHLNCVSKENKFVTLKPAINCLRCSPIALCISVTNIFIVPANTRLTMSTSVSISSDWNGENHRAFNCSSRTSERTKTVLNGNNQWVRGKRECNIEAFKYFHLIPRMCKTTYLQNWLIKLDTFGWGIYLNKKLFCVQTTRSRTTEIE